MAALVVLSHFGAVATLAAGRRRLAEHEGPLVFDSSRVIRGNLMAVAATNLRRGHAATAELLDNPGAASPMAYHAVVGTQR